MTVTTVERTITIKFDTRAGEATTNQVVASCLALVDGRLAQCRVRGQIDSYDTRVVRPEEARQ